jgi:hypothetical protein
MWNGTTSIYLRSGTLNSCLLTLQEYIASRRLQVPVVFPFAVFDFVYSEIVFLCVR